MAKGTVSVNLAKDWFAPDGSLYQSRDNPHNFPAEYADKPKELSDEDVEAGKVRSKKQKYAVLPSTAEIVGEDTRTVVVLQDTANGSKVQVAVPVEDVVKSVGGALDEKGIEQPDQSVAAAEKGAKEASVEVGGKPRESGPLPAGSVKK